LIITKTANRTATSSLLVLLLDNKASTTDSTSSSGSDETDLLTGRRVAPDCTWLTNMLMVTTTVGMLDWILGDTSNLGPAVTLDTVFVVGSAGFEDRLVNSSTTGDETKNGSVLAGEQLLDTRWELDSSSAGVCVVGYDGAVASRGLCDLTTVTSLLLERAHDGTFWHSSDGEDVADVELGLLTAVDELTGADAFRADHGLGDSSVLVWVLELNFGERGATARVVYDVLDQTLDEALSLGIVERSELGGSFSAFRSGCKDRPSTFTLALDHAPHDTFCKFDLRL